MAGVLLASVRPPGGPAGSRGHRRETRDETSPWGGVWTPRSGGDVRSTESRAGGNGGVPP
eukprot:2988031-Pyramimonas_sp.AAC.1